VVLGAAADYDAAKRAVVDWGLALALLESSMASAVALEAAGTRLRLHASRSLDARTDLAVELTRDLRPLLRSGGGSTAVGDADSAIPAAAAAGGNGSNPEDSVTLGISRRLASGALVKAKVDGRGALGLLYQQSVAPGVLATVSVRADARDRARAPTFGFALDAAQAL
jgi:hypothetical protein